MTIIKIALTPTTWTGDKESILQKHEVVYDPSGHTLIGVGQRPDPSTSSDGERRDHESLSDVHDRRSGADSGVRRLRPRH